MEQRGGSRGRVVRHGVATSPAGRSRACGVVHGTTDKCATGGTQWLAPPAPGPRESTPRQSTSARLASLRTGTRRRASASPRIRLQSSVGIRQRIHAPDQRACRDAGSWAL